MRHLQLDLEGCDSGLRVFRPRGRAEGVVYDLWFSAFRDQFVFFWTSLFRLRFGD